MIKPASRNDVTVSVIGLDFNTPDSLMMEYIRKFGGVIVNNKVIYSRYMEGPFKGKYTGERKYQVDLTASTRSMGTYHFIDGAKIRIFYRGNDKTCGRCHQTPRTCPGKGLAKDCQAAGSQRVNLFDHMRDLWSNIGFTPSGFTLPQSDEDQNAEGEGDKPFELTSKFKTNITRTEVREEDTEKYSGITITNFSLEVTENDILKFIAEKVSKM